MRLFYVATISLVQEQKGVLFRDEGRIIERGITLVVTLSFMPQNSSTSLYRLSI